MWTTNFLRLFGQSLIEVWSDWWHEIPVLDCCWCQCHFLYGGFLKWGYISMFFPTSGAFHPHLKLCECCRTSFSWMIFDLGPWPSQHVTTAPQSWPFLGSRTVSGAFQKTMRPSPKISSTIPDRMTRRRDRKRGQQGPTTLGMLNFDEFEVLDTIRPY